MVIWKFPLSVLYSQTIMMPIGAQVLTAQLQMGELQIWALCNPDDKIEREPRVFSIHATESTVNENHEKYISTFQIASERLVFHVFEVTNH